MNDARAIANFILDEFDAVENEISNKKINKLIYYSHGFSLLRLGVPLIKNHVEAWIHGPVVRVVYDAFKQFEFRPIVGRAVCFNYVSDADEQVSYAEIVGSQLDLTKRVVSYYAKFSADELEEMTHSQFGPWAKIWNTPENQRGLRSRIPDVEILAYFQKKHGEDARTN